MVEFGLDLGPRGARKGCPRLQLGERPQNAAAGGLLRALKMHSAVMGDERGFGPSIVHYTR